MSEKNEKGLFDYFKMSEAVDDVKYSYGAKDKTVSALKLVGKGLFNSARFVVESAPKVIEEVAKQQMNQSDKQLRRTDLNDEQRDRLTEVNEKSREIHQEYKERNKNK